MKRLDKPKLKKLYEEYDIYFDGDKKQIAYELAKDFIYNAQLEYESYLNTHYKEFGVEILKERADLRSQAIWETWEFIH